MITLVSFASSNMKKTLARLGKEAEESGFFDRVVLLTEKNFDSDYWSEYGDFMLSNPRGYGFYLWKSYCCKKALEELNDGDFLVYLDAGCEVNKYGRKRFDDYLNIAKSSPLGFCVFRNDNLLEKCWTKGDVFDFFDEGLESNLANSDQLLGGIFVVYVSPVSRELISEWYNTVHQHLSLITDAPSVAPCSDAFIENRHDQSVFSVLLKKRGITSLSGWEVQSHPATNQRLSLLRYNPFLAIRNRTGNPRLNKLQRKFLPLCNWYWYWTYQLECWLRTQYHRFV